MNKELLEKLKQSYSYIGLAENVLQLHADALVATGIVTPENIDGIVAKQKDYLEGLQRYNDARVGDAVRKAGEKALKDTEEKVRKAAEEAAAKAKEEAVKAAAEEARKARELAEQDATEKAQKAAEEAARKAKEEAERNLPESVKVYLESLKSEYESAASASRKAAEEAAKAAADAQKAKEEAWEKRLKEMSDSLAGFRKENDELKKAQAVKDRQNAIMNKAKELGIPQWRIDEGFVIADDATEEQYGSYLSTIAKNIKANQLPEHMGSKLAPDQKVSKEEVDSIAKSMVENL